MDLVACKKCHRQFDVSGHKIGERVRCLCDAVFEVEKPKPHQAKILRCSSCAGQLEAGAEQCPYCQGQVAFSDRDLTSVCPECFVRIPGSSKFCVQCGTGIQPQSIRPVPVDSNCPRCDGSQGSLQSRALQSESVIECSACAGVWIVPEIFDRICDDVQRNPIANVNQSLGDQVEVPKQNFRYLGCLVCDDKMVPRNFGGISGIMIDVCRHHGVWLDDQELAAVVEFVRKGGLKQSREFGHGNGQIQGNSPMPTPTSQSTPPYRPKQHQPDLLDSLIDAADGFLDLFR